MQSRQEQLVPLDSILPSPFQPRKSEIGRGDVRDLMELIKANGQLTPIVVSPSKESEGQYYVHAGHRRCAALRFLGQDKVRALIQDLNDRDARKLALCENLGREDLSAMEQARAIEAYAEDYEISFRDAARELGIGERTRVRLSTLTAAPEALQELLASHRMSARSADIIAKLERKRPGVGVQRVAALASGATNVTRLEKELKRLQSGSEPAPMPLDKVSCDITEDRLALRIQFVSPRPEEGDLRHALNAIDRTREALLEMLGESARPPGVVIGPQ